jgi:hypothetical protein
MPHEVRPADPGARRRALVIVLVTVALGVIAVVVTQGRRHLLADWLVADPSSVEVRVRVLLFVTLAVAILPSLAFAAYLSWLGGAVVRAEEFPPAGWRVVRDTPVLRGAAAVRRGRLVRGFGLGLAGVASAVGLVSWRLVAAVGGWHE